MNISVLKVDSNPILPTAEWFQSLLRGCVILLLVSFATTLIHAQADSPVAEDETEPELEIYEVTGSRLGRIELEGSTPVISFDRNFIDSTGFGTFEELMRVLPQNFTGAGAGRMSVPNDENTSMVVRMPGQSGLGLGGLGSNNTLVLINGRRAPLSGIGNRFTPTQQGFFDINTIPLGLVERVEILTDGSSAIYGADAVGGVVNIILKQNYQATEITGRFAGSFHGGASERGVTLTTGYGTARYNVSLTLDTFNRKPLFATQRWFSRDQDHRPRGGGNFASNIGYPNTIFALPGQVLQGVFNPNGTPATQAVVPSGQDGRNLTPADFNATAGQSTSFQSGTLYALIPPTDRQGLTARGEYRFNDNLTLFGDFSFTRSQTKAKANPLITSAQTGALNQRIPANNPFNPFNQVLGFRMAHVELGPRSLEADTKSYRALAGLRYQFNRDWSVETSYMYYISSIFNSSPVLDRDAMIAALNETDPTRALNLFGDVSQGRTNAPGVYESIVSSNITEADSEVFSFDAILRGKVIELPAGIVRFALGGERGKQDRYRTTNNPSTIEPAESRSVRRNTAYFGEVTVPLFSPKQEIPLFHSLRLDLAGRYEDIENSGTSRTPQVAMRWQPFEKLLLRGSYSEGYRAPALSELERPERDTNPLITDFRRNNERYNAAVVSGSFPNLGPETSETWTYGMVLTMPFVDGLTISLDAYKKDQRNLTSSFTTNLILTHEELFPDRVFRDPPSAADAAAGLPGRVNLIDARFTNLGQVVTEGLNFNLTYALPWERFGRFTYRISGTYYLSYKIAFNPGDDLVERRGSFGYPQKVKGNTSLMWSHNKWNAAVFCYHQGSADRAGRRLGSFTTFDVNFGYNWSERVRIQGGIGNIFDKAPPFANTTWGFDGGFHSARMATYNFRLTYRL